MPRAGIHRDGAAHRSRDTYEKLHAGQLGGKRHRNEGIELGTGSCGNASVICTAHFRELLTQGDHASAVAGIGHENV